MPHPRRPAAALRRRALWLLAFAGACALRNREEEVNPLDEAIAAAEAQFSRRAEGPEALDAAIEGWREALAMAPADPRVLAGLSRAYAARAYGYGAPNPQLDYEIARTYAWTCLMLDSGFAARVSAEGGRPTERAARLLSARFLPCLEADVYAALRWVELRGPAASLDLADIGILANRLAEAETSWVGPWSQAMVQALQPDPARRDEAAIGAAFDAADSMSPELWIAASDRLIQAEQLDEGRWSELLDREAAGAWKLENAAAQARLRALR